MMYSDEVSKKSEKNWKLQYLPEMEEHPLQSEMESDGNNTIRW